MRWTQVNTFYCLRSYFNRNNCLTALARLTGFVMKQPFCSCRESLYVVHRSHPAASLPRIPFANLVGNPVTLKHLRSLIQQESKRGCDGNSL